MTGIIIHPHGHTVANQNTAVDTVREVFQITRWNQRVAVNSFFGGLSIKVSQKQLERWGWERDGCWLSFHTR